MTDIFHGTGKFSDPDGFMETVRREAGQEWSKELARLKRLSLMAGTEVVFDLSMFELEWSPAFRHDGDEPVAWVNLRTGERRDGSTDPNSTGAAA